ncbi:MAG: AbrB/MazE/SpoVT family DNA-binding domain-containing protein [Acidobacteriaceae bacterium]
MTTANLRKVGGSIMVVVPPAILKELHLRAGATVGLVVEGERLVIDPKVKPRYTMDELLAQCDAAALMDEEDRRWIDMPSVGQEL